MKLQEVLTEYQYNNVGQFRAIAESLGYKEAYNKGSLLFTRNDEVFRIDMDKIRSHTKREPDLSAEKASMGSCFASSLIGIRLYLPTIKAY